MARLYGAIAVVATYIIVRRIVEPRGHGDARNEDDRGAGAPAWAPPYPSRLRPRSPSTTTAESWCVATVEVAVPKGASTQSRDARRARARPRSSRSIRPWRSPASRYDGAVDEGSALRRSVGKRLVFRIRTDQETDTVSALVLGVDPLRLQLPDGRVMFTQPGAALYPADVVVADPTVRLGLESARAQKKPSARLLHGGRGVAGELSDRARWQTRRGSPGWQ